MGQAGPTYSELISAADRRHRDRMWEAKAALIDAQWAAAAEYNVTGSFHVAESALKAAMDAADARYAKAVALSVAIRKRDFEEAFRQQANA